MTETDVLNALKDACVRVGTQQALADMAGLSQSTISDYLRGRCSVGNMTVSTLLRLFPDMIIEFFGKRAETPSAELRRAQLLKIFDGLSEEAQLAAIAMMAANFGEKIRQETKK